MSHLPYLLLFLALLAGPTWLVAKDAPGPKPISGAGNDLDVPYLPLRLGAQPIDGQMKLNVHWPQEGGPFPCVIIVHGGSYTGGTKDERGYQRMAEDLVGNGFVAVNLNYILGREIFPQVFYDFKAAVRFLRVNAAKYRIDPDRIGAWGLSAGGWLITSGGFSSAGDISRGTGSLNETWAADDPRRRDVLGRLARTDRDSLLTPMLVPMDDPRPAYAESSSRLQAIQADFSHNHTLISADDPAICTYVGKGGRNPMEKPATEAGLDYHAIVVPKARSGESTIHVPDLKQPVPLPGGGEGRLSDLVIRWFREQLVEKARTPSVEFRPNRRVFADQVEVQAITTSAPIAVHYTTDGSEPTTASPRWTAPLTLNATTTVKALAVRQGMRPSGVATVTFTKGEVPPTIAGPDKLPAGKVGSPYEVAFTTVEGKPATWAITAQHLRGDWQSKELFAAWSGVGIDRASGVLSGTPTKAGAFTVQVRAAWKTMQLADTRTYLLIIEP